VYKNKFGDDNKRDTFAEILYLKKYV